MLDPVTFVREPTTVSAPSSVVDDLDQTGHRRRALIWVGGLSAVLLATLPLGVGIGAVSLPPSTVLEIVTHHLFDWPQAVRWSPAQDAIVWQVRAPRVLLGAVVGAALAASGVALQALVRNVLADPYLLG
ncbi:MAG: iron chelate uptake ABC transporter family permease subunit, partial [Steroidobacteraceae bacterium]